MPSLLSSIPGPLLTPTFSLGQPAPDCDLGLGQQPRGDLALGRPQALQSVLLFTLDKSLPFQCLPLSPHLFNGNNNPRLLHLPPVGFTRTVGEWKKMHENSYYRTKKFRPKTLIPTSFMHSVLLQHEYIHYSLIAASFGLVFPWYNVGYLKASEKAVWG